MYSEEKEDTYCQGYELDGSREGIDARGQDGTDIVSSRVVIVICPATAGVIAGRSRLRFGWRTRSVILHGRACWFAIAIHCFHLPIAIASLHTSSSFERMQAHACIVRPGGRLGFALLVLFVRALLILAHEVIADVMMTVIDYRP